MSILHRLNRETGLTILLVTHEREWAEFADRIVTMRDGLIVAEERTTTMQSAKVGARAPTRPTAELPRTAADAPSLRSLCRMTFDVSIRAIARNKLRSALTMLGIFIGVAALIAMVAIGQGANAAVAAQIDRLGANMLIVMPGAFRMGGVHGGGGSASTLRVTDAEAILKQAPAVERVSYVIRDGAQAQYGNQNWNTTVQGVSPSYLQIQNWPLASGRMFSAEEQQSAARVCLLGMTVARNLFGTHQNPIGATVIVKNVPLRVIGLLSELGQTGYGRDLDDVILIPFTTGERKVLGVAAPSQDVLPRNEVYATSPNPFGIRPKLTGFVNLIFVQAKSADRVGDALAQVRKILETRHRIRPGDVADFDLHNISQVAEAREGSARVMGLLLAMVASISLLVGGIGIMNILLVSVTERTREIGIRLAIGARRVHVLLQFLVEAVLLSGIGGLCGVATGIAISKAVSWLAGWPTLLSPGAIGIGFFFSAAVGIFFGYYPARRASLLNPIEALRYE